MVCELLTRMYVLYLPLPLRAIFVAGETSIDNSHPRPEEVLRFADQDEESACHTLRIRVRSEK